MVKASIPGQMGISICSALLCLIHARTEGTLILSYGQTGDRKPLWHRLQGDRAGSRTTLGCIDETGKKTILESENSKREGLMLLINYNVLGFTS